MIVSELSQLLEVFVKLCEECENLNPLSDRHKTECVHVCTWGGRCIDLLNQVNICIDKEHEILGKLKQLDPGTIEKSLDESKKNWQCVQIWGRALEHLEKLKGAMCFCESLLGEKTECSKGKKYRFEFRDKSIDLAFHMLYELQEIITGYKVKDYPNLRIQLIYSYLKDFRNLFIQIARVEGNCCVFELPDECKNHNPKDITEGTLNLFHGHDKHELIFNVVTRPPLKWHIDNTGLLDYTELLRNIWDRDSGQSRFSKCKESATWIVDHPEGIERLEDAANKICRVVQGLRSIKEYEELAKSILEIVRNRSLQWETCKVPWEYLHELDKIIAKLKEIPKQHKLSKSKQPETDQKDKQNDGHKENWHNADYTEVLWNSEKYTFNKTQARIIEYLWINKRASEKSIGGHIESDNENYHIRHTFRQKKGKKCKIHPAFGKMITKDGKGIYALNEKDIKSHSK